MKRRIVCAAAQPEFPGAYEHDLQVEKGTAGSPQHGQLRSTGYRCIQLQSASAVLSSYQVGGTIAPMPVAALHRTLILLR